MKVESPFFDLPELVCEHVYEKYGNFAWNFLDPRLIVTINTIRDRIGKAIFVNDWQIHGDKSQRGLRCPECEIVKAKKELYMSAHCLGKAVDFECQGLVSSEVRMWLIKNKNWWPYSFRLEDNVSWVHLDLYSFNTGEKITLFNK